MDKYDETRENSFGKEGNRLPGETCGLPEGLEVAGAVGDGYEVLACFGAWKVAAIGYAERFDRANLRRLERHMETDEVFVLMAGAATLFIGAEGMPVRMELYKTYNVKQGAWHNICVSRDAKVLICENADTGPENTEYRILEGNGKS